MGLAYFYVDGFDQQPLDVECLYRTFIGQLASQTQALPNLLKRFYQLHGSERSSRRDLVTDEQWRNLFEDLMREFDNIYIVIDAVDECEDSMGLATIMDFIQGIWDGGKHRLHLLTSSRDLERIRKKFDVLQAKHVHVHGEALDSDICMALRNQLCKDSKFDRWPLSLRDTIETSLMTQAQGW